MRWFGLASPVTTGADDLISAKREHRVKFILLYLQTCEARQKREHHVSTM